MFRSVLKCSSLILLLFIVAVCMAQKEVVLNVDTSYKPITIDDYDGDGWHPRSIAKYAQYYYDTALNYYNRYTKLNPADAQAWCNQGIIEFRLQKYKLARQDFNNAIKLDSTLCQAYYYRGFTKFKLGNRDGALKDCNQAITIKPCDTTYRSLGVLRAWMRNFSQAKQALTKAIELNSAYVDAYVRRARVEGQMRKFDAAKNDFAKAIMLDSNYAEAYIERANLEEDLDEFAGAISDCNKAILLSPDNPQAFINRGWEKEMLEQSDSAIVDFNRAIDLAPDFALAYSCRCAAKQSKGNLEGALKDCDRSVQIDSTLYYGYGNRSMVRHSLMDYEGAHKDFTKWMKLLPVDNENRNQRSDTAGSNPGGSRFTIILPIDNMLENTNQIKTDLKLENLQGHVKTIHETTWIDTSGKPAPYNIHAPYLKHLYRFNEYGYITETQYYSDSVADDALTDSIAIKFNNNGQQTEFTDYDGRNHAGKFQIIYVYNNLGKIEKKTERDLHLGCLQEWQYNEKGDEIAGQFISDNKVKYTRTVSYHYNDNGKIKQAAYITVRQNKSDTTIWDYDYDNKGNMTVSGIRYHNGVRHKLDSETYDINNNLLQSGHLSQPNEHHPATSYDKYGNLTMQGTYLPDGELKILWEAIYEYDSKGNWIKIKAFPDKEANTETTRIIEYY